MVRRQTLYLLLGAVAFGLASEWMLWQSRANPVFLAIMSAVLVAAHWLDAVLPAATSLTSLQSELLIVMPLTAAYFSFIAYWANRILREEGIFRFAVFLFFLGFLAVLHWQAYEYLSTLFWSGQAGG